MINKSLPPIQWSKIWFGNRIFIFFRQREMASLDLKENVLAYINSADERLLKMIKALVESYQETNEHPGLSEAHKKL